MNLKLSEKAKGVIGAIAPTLGTALGGPLGGLAAQVLVGALGIEPDKVDQMIAQQSPEIMQKLRVADQEFAVKMRELDLREEDLANQDRQGARELFRVNQSPQIILSAVFVLGYFVVLWAMLAGSVSILPDLKDVVLVLIGLITREFPTIMQFWFGSSTGSKIKDAKL